MRTKIILLNLIIARLFFLISLHAKPSESENEKTLSWSSYKKGSFDMKKIEKVLAKCFECVSARDNRNENSTLTKYNLGALMKVREKYCVY